MIPGSEEAGSPIQEGKEDESSNKVRKGASTSSPLLRLKDPRIVRVSRAFGGKDRHSKVFTIRGLRDRRVRLSVPTAIQLYDLQDRLGLNQPSKVVDWLLNEAKHEIEELPPLPIPQSHGFVAPQTEEVHNFNVVPLSSTLSLSSGSQNHFQMLSSGAQNPFANPPQYSITQPDLRPFHLSIAPRLLPHSLNINGSQPGKEDEFPSK
ncbi:hypothetical protein GOBAR_AA18867 [Gossypium barbadense]|uniref:TCP domain-containing protein n=1 Tax=Gossypium barbadense TaxID=3634 RepID=A0A2P5XEN2_GOSBA|nr:hypothetical protein GOBAR_AA18867 [Gossypium barbadense]